MILYTLRCAHGHEFESWFSNSAEYDEKKAAGQLTCPECASTEVSKAIMAPRVAKAAAPAPACGTPQGCGACPMSGHM